LKKENPTFGIKRISQVLRRCFFLPASPYTVRQRLHDAELMTEGSPRKKRNLTRPRFFERATPNQMWQTDIFTFRLGGRYAYVIAFMDDYSRFIVGADLFRSPTAQAVIEVYRVAAGEFQPPKEMLTDNGRQQVQQQEQKEQLRQLLNQWAARDNLKPAKKTRNDPPNPAPARHHERNGSDLMAAVVRPRALRQRHALA
jgi:transposase InsO family protein